MRSRSSVCRKIPAGPITPEQIEVLISGDLEGGALIPRLPEFAGPVFRDLAHARLTWRRNWKLVLKIHRLGWEAGDCEPTRALQCANWLRDGAPCWAEAEFGLPHGAKSYLKGLAWRQSHPPITALEKAVPDNRAPAEAGPGLAS